VTAQNRDAEVAYHPRCARSANRAVCAFEAFLLPTPTAMPLLRRSLLICALAPGLPAWATRSITAEGLTFPGDIRLADTALQLNGVGFRAVAWLKGYAAGLYLPKKAGTEAQVLQQMGAKRLQMRMLQDVDAEEFVKAFVKGVDRNTLPADAARLGERMTQFNTLVRGLVKLKKKDVIDLDFIPGKGLVLSRNGAPRGAPVAGEDFYAALLRCFVGVKPADADMKVGLLGGPVG
jgi:Chalcone isomerase-like